MGNSEQPTTNVNPSELIGTSENQNTISNINAGDTTVNELQEESTQQQNEKASLQELRQKITDLKHEL